MHYDTCDYEINSTKMRNNHKFQHFRNQHLFQGIFYLNFHNE